MSLEQFFDSEACTDHVILVGGQILNKANGEGIEVIFDDEGTKYYRFTVQFRDEPSPHASEKTWDYWHSHAEQVTVRADQVIGFSQEVEL